MCGVIYSVWRYYSAVIPLANSATNLYISAIHTSGLWETDYMTTKRYAYFVSDGTGITAENVGRSLITQFPGIEFEELSLPYVDTPEKAERAVTMINESKRGIERPIVVSTIISDEIRAIVQKADALMLDSFDAFLGPIEKELSAVSNHEMGQTHNIANEQKYQSRMDAVHYSLDNDDGAQIKNYADADIILVGVSRCGKTPTCLYLALQYGIKAANYPITEDDADNFNLPRPLQAYRAKLFGLTIAPNRLSAIRNERRPNSRYSSLRQCADEVRMVEAIYRKHRVPSINTTHHSVEEISTRILAEVGIKRKML